MLGVHDNSVDASASAPRKPVEDQLSAESASLSAWVDRQSLEVAASIGSAEKGEARDLAADSSDAQSRERCRSKRAGEFQGVHFVTCAERGEVRGEHVRFIAGPKRRELGRWWMRSADARDRWPA